MKLTKANTTTFVRQQLATKPEWAVRAMVRIFQENQTADEQTDQLTKHDNGIGFSGTDAQFLSSLAKQFIAKDYLSEKQVAFVLKKMPKYVKQVITMSNKAQLDAMVEAAK
jgi:hypothetical protein